MYSSTSFSNSSTTPVTKRKLDHSLLETKIPSPNKSIKYKPNYMAPPPSMFIDLSQLDDNYQGDNIEIIETHKPIVPPKKIATVTRKSIKGASSKQSYTNNNIIDLTGSVHPSMSQIRSTNKLYFTYDPRGQLIKHEDVALFCEDCRCPKEYCAEKVFGELCYNQVEHLVGKLGFEVIDTQLMVIQYFKRSYTEMVHHKMMVNKIPFRNYNVQRYVHVPECMRLNSLRKIIDDVALWKERSLEVVSYGPDSDDDDASDLPELKGRDSEDSGDDMLTTPVKDMNANHTKTERTAVEQAKDVGPMFKLMKQRYMSSMGKR